MLDFDTPMVALVGIVIIALVITIGFSITDQFQAQTAQVPAIYSIWPAIVILGIILPLFFWLRRYGQQQQTGGFP